MPVQLNAASKLYRHRISVTSFELESHFPPSVTEFIALDDKFDVFFEVRPWAVSTRRIA